MPPNRMLSRHRGLRLPAFLAAALTGFLAAGTASAQDVRLERPSADKIEVTGGPVDARWRIPYGTGASFTAAVYSESAPEGHAYFTHGPWLRLIDVTRGLVVGRWRFPGLISNVSPLGAGGRVAVRFDGPRDLDPSLTTAVFDPATGSVPAWDTGAPLSYRASESEAGPLTASTGTDGSSSAAEDRARLADIEEAARRDPHSPWLLIARGKLLRDAGDPRANDVLDQAVRGGVADFADLFRIAGFLERVDAPGPARTAFDRAYTDYLERGNDPRLITLLGRLALYSPFPPNQAQLSDAKRAELVERVYLLSPTTEGSGRAWAAYADYFERRGQTEQARVWRARAEVSRTQGLVGLVPDLVLAHDRLFLIVAASLVTALILIGCLYLKYAPERRLAIAAQTARGPWRRGIGNLQYWSRRERVAFLLIVLAGWCAAGLTSPVVRVVSREAAMPCCAGSFEGPMFKTFFATRLAATPWRELLMAIGHQQGGEHEEAERLYRGLPQFAESWNNLGVLLRTAGKEAEARDAFVRARQLDPQLPEAAMNMGESVGTFASNVLQRYLPTRPILALPQRDQLLSAYLGTRWNARFARALLGPFAMLPAGLELRRGLGVSEHEVIALWPEVPILLLVALGISILLWLVPSSDVTQAPGKGFRVCEWLFPGISPAWRAFGPPVLLVWTLFLLVALLQLRLGTPYVLAEIALPGLQRAFGLPPEIPNNGFSDINPNPGVLLGVLALLFAVNLALVGRARRVP